MIRSAPVGASAKTIIVVMLVGLGACVEPHTTSCGDLVCPVGKVCADAHQVCVLPDQVEACTGMADRAPCAYPGVPEGACTGGVCFDTTCGNGIVEGDEVCDDGNIADGDGCSADCRSDETCGNGIIDPQMGEACDDGNNVSGDGCQATCALPRCGDGIVDADEACDDGNNVSGDGCHAACLSDETCGNGVIDVIKGEQCDDSNLAVGDGCGATCKIEVCGNNIIDPGEVCDDGNTLSGDACRADCLSDETCGNGIADTTVGEQCDDGGFQSSDGCSSICTVELPTWQQLDGSLQPRSSGHAAVYDSARRRLVLFGGRLGAGEPSNETWTWDGRKWLRLELAVRPGRRRNHVMVYDAARRVSVLFGGRDQMGELGDTWEFDGTTWTQVTPATSPGPRSHAAAAYDAASQRVVLHGGQDSTGALGDTWTYDGVTWTPVTGATPGARLGHVMAYDAARMRTVLFGGEDATELDDTWEWDGATWTEVTPATTPTARGAVAYDAARATLVLFGGGAVPSDVTWEYSGGDWIERTLPAAPPVRIETTMAYDPVNRVMVMVGGYIGVMGQVYDDTWTYDGTGWVQVTSDLEPPGRIQEGMAYDALRGRVIMFGGRAGSPSLAPIDDTWSFDGRQWSLVEPRDSPPAGPVAAMEYYPPSGVTVMVRQSSPPGPELETWTFNGATWTPLLISSPPSRQATTLAYDPNRGVLVLHGGGSGGPSPTLLTDTWEFDGFAWTETTPAASPPARVEASSAYDAFSQRIILFGGAPEGVPVGMGGNDTWAYDGTTWVELTLDPKPGPRAGTTMVRHAARNTIVLYRGGFVGPNTDDIWEFDGQKWSAIALPEIPPVGRSPRMAYDAARKRITARAGDPQNTTWHYAYSSTAPTEVCTAPGDEDGDGLSDCADPDCEESACGSPNLVCRAGACVCTGGATETHCGDGFDDDCDGLIDCLDPDCTSSTYCSTEVDCAPGLDDDGDGETDCADPGCHGTASCEAYETSCGDGLDNDGDGVTDCADPDCYLNPCADLTAP